MESNKIELVIYDLSKGKLRCLSRLIWTKKKVKGMFHVSLRIYGNEYYFEMNGRVITTPEIYMKSTNLKPYDIIYVGMTNIGKDDFEDLFKTIIINETYNIFSNNCIHFTDKIIKEILKIKYSLPEYIIKNPQSIRNLLL